MNNLKVLVVGSGGREHALAWSLARSSQVEQVYVAPGNAGTEWAENPNAIGLQPRAVSLNVPIAAEDIPALQQFALDNAIDLTVVGPEVPLSMGIVDDFQAAGLRIFGPTKAAARLEASKAYAKQFMQENNIPTAEFEVFTDYEAACKFVRSFGRPVVVKADGLAAGKGVIVCDNADEAEAALRRMLLDGEFGEAGCTVVVEERLEGDERSVLAFCKGDQCEIMPFARDHKRAFDGDTGPNTGGMGVYTDDKQRSEMVAEVITQFFKPTLTGLMAQGTPYSGVLYAGLMLTADGMKVLEYNCRFGDPETQAILPLLGDDLADVLLDHINPAWASLPGIFWGNGHVASIVLASPGYPGSYPKGLPINGLDTMPEKVVVFHAGTARQNGQIVTNGGRVLNVTGIGITLDKAIERAYAGVEKIHFEGMHYRRDIGRKA